MRGSILSTPAFSSDAFGWPGFASCDPDPADPNFPPRCRTTFPDSSPIFQKLTVAEAWRALALSGRMIPGSVKVGVVDSGIAPSHPDYPPVHIGADADLSEQSEADKAFHGTKVVLSGYGQVGNGFGAAGPGGPVATVDLEGAPITRDGIIAGLGDAFSNLSRVVSTSVVSMIPGPLVPFDNIADQTQQIRSQGTLIFAAAGNDGVDVDTQLCLNTTPIPGILQACFQALHYSPCQDDGVICVSGMRFNDTSKEPGSNWASDSKVVAGPYWTEISSVPIALDGNGFAQPQTTGGSFDNAFAVGFNGTSAATPFVAGSASLLVAADPTQTADREEHCLFEPIHPNSDGAFNTLVPDILASVKCMITGSAFGDLPTFLHIDLPVDGSNVSPGQLLNIKATATDYELGELTVTWTSDVDTGTSTTGSDATGVFKFPTRGVQHLTASAVGSDGILMHQTITVNVGAPTSSVFIVRPTADGLQLPLGLPVTLAVAPTLSSGIGTLLDCAAAKWSSTSGTGVLDFDGLTGCTIQPTFSTLGSHQVVVAYTDPTTGVKSVANREIEMIAVNGFFAQIASPANTGQQAFSFDQLITLGAQAINGTNGICQRA